MRTLIAVSLVFPGLSLNVGREGWGSDSSKLKVQASDAVKVAAAVGTAAALKQALDEQEQDPDFDFVGALQDGKLKEKVQESVKGMTDRETKNIQEGLNVIKDGAKDSRKFDMVRGMLDQAMVQPVSGILKNHDKEQISSLKKKGKITEGFPDLTFAHIPKTGGDAFAMASTPLFPYGFGLRSNLALHLMVDPTKTSADYCYFEQLPPQKIEEVYSKKVLERAYQKRTVFCSVRNPYDRLVSEWHNCVEFGAPGDCSSECDVNDMNKWITTQLTAFKEGDYYRHSCFYVPQTEYLEGPGACTEVLDFNHLEDEFKSLMEKHGYNLTLPAVSDTHRTYNRKCQGKITSKHLTDETRQLIEEVYAKDFEKLGVKFGWVEETLGQKLKRYIATPINTLVSDLETEAKFITGQDEDVAQS